MHYLVWFIQKMTRKTNVTWKTVVVLTTVVRKQTSLIPYCLQKVSEVKHSYYGAFLGIEC
jgi:hypothetical protein